MVLTSAGFERFREAMENRRFAGHIRGMQEEYWQFTEEEPVRTLLKIGDEQGIRMDMEQLQEVCRRELCLLFQRRMDFSGRGGSGKKRSENLRII